MSSSVDRPRRVPPSTPPAPRLTTLTAPTHTVLASAGGAAAIELPAGSELGRYVLLERIGQGGMGVVYSARDTELQRKVALKLLHDFGPAEQARLRERIRREAQAMAQMAHPNVVTVYDVGSWQDSIFIAMEMVEGLTLQAWLARGGRSWREVVAVFMSAGEGLAAAHASGLVHRDFKPANVLIGHDGRVRVGDFGLAAIAATAGQTTGEVPAGQLPTSREFTMPLAGTPYYMAPEQLRGDAADSHSDQFSFCVALYEAIAGEHPFAAERVDDGLVAIMDGPVRTPARPRSMPRWLYRVLLRGLSIDPAGRHPSMRSLLESLSRHAARRWLAVGASALAGAVLVGLVGLGWVERDESRAPSGVGGPASRHDDVFAGAPEVREAYEREWAATQTDACESPRARCAVQATNLLRGAGFDRPGRAWRAADGDPGVRLDWRAGVLNVTAASEHRSVVQEVPWIVTPGRSYSLSLWVRVPGDGGPIGGRLMLWGIGRGGATSATTQFRAQGQWSQVSVTLSPKAHYYRFRAEVHLDSPGSIDLDNAELVDAGLVDASFEDSSIVHRSAAWRPYNLPDHVQTRWLVTDAFDGARALEVRTARKDGSVAQDTLQSPLAGTTYMFIARIRAGADAAAVAGNLVLWALGDEHRPAVTGFEVDRRWTEVAVSLDVQEHGVGALRAEVYLSDANAALEIDATKLVPAGLVNGGFEAGASGWSSASREEVELRGMSDPSARGASGLFEPGRKRIGAREGSGWLRMRSTRPGASLGQELENPLVGTTYSFSAWVRAPGPRPVSGRLAIRAPGTDEQAGTPPGFPRTLRIKISAGCSLGGPTSASAASGRSW